jgi:hypothetical protein
MPLADYEEIDLTGLDIDGWKRGFSVITHKLGEGVTVAARVGSTHGMWSWTLSSGAQPDRDTDQINSLSRFEYYQDFIQRHTTGDTRVFVIDFRGKKWTAVFPNVEESGSMHTYDLFDISDVQIDQEVVTGETYASDGSISTPDPPSVPTGFRGSVAGPTDILLEWDASVDDVTPSIPEDLTITGSDETTISLSWSPSID